MESGGNYTEKLPPAAGKYQSRDPACGPVCICPREDSQLRTPYGKGKEKFPKMQDYPLCCHLPSSETST